MKSNKFLSGLIFITIAFFVFLFAPPADAKQVVPLPDLEKPQNIVIDQDQILITQFPLVYVYDLKDYKLVTQFGKAGEGPREFFNYVRIQKDAKNPQYIVVGSHMKMSYFTRDGKYVKEKRSESSSGNVYKPFGDRYVAYGFFRDNEKKINWQTINLFDNNLKKIKEVYREKNLVQPGKQINALATWGAWFRLFDNKIFITGERDGVILVYDYDGNKINEITYDFKKLSVSDSDKKRFHDFFKVWPQTRQVYDNIKQLITFPKFFPTVRGMDVNNGKVYVNGYPGEDKNTCFYIFDLKGTLLKKDICLDVVEENPRDLYPYTIYHDKLYQLVDNGDTEEWELHIHEL